MRCPKCQYISFDRSDRCRNCGYDFSLSVDATDIDLPIQSGTEPLGPMSDLKLTDLDTGSQPAAAPRGASRDVTAEPARPRHPAAGAPADLPLFTGPADDDAPLVTPTVPRPPLAVRRATAPAARHSAHGEERDPEISALDLGEPEERTPVDREIAPAQQADAPVPAPFGRRLGAALIDVALLGAIDLTVLYFTLQLCGLRVSEIRVIPVIPFGAFVLLLNAAYFVAFTAAGGQTMGKMAAGIRVIPSYPEADVAERVPFGFAVLRAVAYLISVLPAGVGFIPALVGSEHRALHDRLADTRVVKA